MVNLVKMVSHHLLHFFQLEEQGVEEPQLEATEEEVVMVGLPQVEVEVAPELLPVEPEETVEMDLQ
jgi:hypothetical protein